MRRGGGFTLLETILATTLLAGVMLLLFNLYPASALAVRRGQDQLVADNLAQSRLDEMRSRDFDALEPGLETRPSVVENGRAYESRVEVFEVDEHPDVVKGVRVTVTWAGVSDTQAVVHETYLVDLER